MKLTYRGAGYEYNPLNPQAIAGETGGKYRGKTWQRYYPRHIPQTQPVAELKYRGVAYCIGDPLDVELMLSKRDIDCVKVTQVDNAKKSVDELAKTHLINLRHNLERRLQVAREKGDSNLVRLLEDEARQIVRG